MAVNRTHRRGMTLLELLLALALTVILMAAISAAIDFYLRTLDSQRSNVEQSQLARAILRNMGNEIRLTVSYEPIDFSGVEQAATGAMSAALGNAMGGISSGGASAGLSTTSGSTAGPTGQGNLSQTATQQNSATSTSATRSPSTATAASGQRTGTTFVTSGLANSNSGGLASGTEEAGTGKPVSIPGLRGAQDWLEVDISRLPRLDEYDALASPAGDSQSVAKIPSDVKTVKYYLRLQDTGSARIGQTISASQTGLVRREVDRAAASYATLGGSPDQFEQEGKVIASEVTSLEFKYFDGEAWLTEWDSDLIGGLPVAVEIVVGIASPRSQRLRKKEGVGANTAYEASEDDLLYRLVVRLPVARPVSELPTAVAATDPLATGTTSGMGTQQGAAP